MFKTCTPHKVVLKGLIKTVIWSAVKKYFTNVYQDWFVFQEKTDAGDCALYIAVVGKQVDIVDSLIKKGANVNQVASYLFSVSHCIVMKLCKIIMYLNFMF